MLMHRVCVFVRYTNSTLFICVGTRGFAYNIVYIYVYVCI